MTSVTVSVAATWRLSRVEFNTPHNGRYNVLGFGEVLLEEPAEASPGATILQTTADAKVYGAMPSSRVSRAIDTVNEDTVVVEGTTVSFAAIMEALPLFFEKWRIEDLENPPAAIPEATMAIPKAAHFTPMPIGVEVPEDQILPPKPIGV